MHADKDCVYPLRPADSMADAKEQVKAATNEALKETFAVNGNRDITKFLPALIGCIARPVSGLDRGSCCADPSNMTCSLWATAAAAGSSWVALPTDFPAALLPAPASPRCPAAPQAETTDCIHQLAATTFVQQVESAPLSIIVPLLVRGLRERATAIKRKSAVIIDNMAKLVENPHDAAPFLPKLLPELEKVANEVADPECRKVAASAAATLLRVGGEGKLTAPKKADPQVSLHGHLDGCSCLDGPQLVWIGLSGQDMGAPTRPMLGTLCG